MNYLDIDWLKEVKEKYQRYFDKAKVLELGSKDVNGNAWGLFTHCKMTGVDWLPGGNVTHLMKAQDTKFRKHLFDVIISMNHLEHDPYWKESLTHNFPSLKSDGLLILSWATPKSTAHSIDADPSGEKKYHPKHLVEVVELVEQNEFKILIKGERNNPYTGIMAYVVAKKS